MPPCMLQFSTWAAADVSAPPERPFREGDSLGGSPSCSAWHWPPAPALPGSLPLTLCPWVLPQCLAEKAPDTLGLVEFSLYLLEPGITAPALPSLAPGHLRLPVAGEPALGTSGPASLCQSQHLEALRGESGRSHLCSYFGRGFLSTDCVLGRARPAERRQQLWGAWPKSETELLVVRVTCSLVTMSESLTLSRSVSFPVK